MAYSLNSLSPANVNLNFYVLVAFAVVASVHLIWSHSHSCEMPDEEAWSDMFSRAFLDSRQNQTFSGRLLTLDGTTRDRFTFYNGLHAGCNGTQLGPISPTGDFKTAVQLCLINPYCTFMAYNPQVGAILCRGRVGNTESGLIVGLDPTLAAEWITADRRGCEMYTQTSASLETSQELPTCLSYSRDFGVGYPSNNDFEAFTPYFDRRVYCYAQLEPSIAAGNVQEALQFCRNDEMCTAVAYNSQDGTTLLCQGFYDVPEKRAADSKGWISAVRRGCELYTAKEARLDKTSLNPPNCHQ